MTIGITVIRYRVIINHLLIIGVRMEEDSETWKKWGTAALGVVCIALATLGLAECIGT